MTKTLLVLGFGMVLAACADDGGGGGAGGGNDTLPKKGAAATDPTIVSATAKCTCGIDVCSTGDPPNAYVRVRVDASDMGGTTNLGTCAGTLGAITDQDTYEGSTCSLYFKTPCTAGSPVTVGLTVSNDKGGVTTASVKLTVSAE